MKLIRVLVAGGRTLNPYQVWEWLTHNAHDVLSRALGEPVRIVAIIEGGATGGDEGGRLYAIAQGPRQCTHCRFDANWAFYAENAGPIRNRMMIAQGRPDVGLIFPGHDGTADMIEQLRSHRIPFLTIPDIGRI